MKKIILIVGLLVTISALADDVSSFDSNKEVMKQKKGDYGEMRRRSDVPLGATQKIWDKSEGGVYEINYLKNDVIKIRIREFMNTTITLPRWEKIKQVFIGNEDIVKSLQPKQNILVLEPEGEVGADTSISVICEGHTYLLYVRIEGLNSKNLPDVGVTIKALPPHGFHQKNKTKVAKEFTKEWLNEMNISPKELDFKFAMSGDRSIAPDLVYSDGFNTWLNYGKNFNKRTVPIIMMVLDGVDTPANYEVIGNSVVVQNVGIITLKNGGKTTCIYPSHLGRHSYA